MNGGTLVVLGLMLVVALSQAADAGARREIKPPEGAPEYQAPPRPGDGAQMALTVEKLEKGFDPGRPFLIWAIGSSFTNFLGNGDTLVAAIRERFPKAPKIVYKKMVGNSTSYHFTRGWAAKVWPDPDATNSHQDPKAMRAMAAKHGVEFVESRREITEYLVENKLPFDSLLVDAVHQSPYCAKTINLNIARHVHRPEHFAYDPRTRERRIEAKLPEALAAGKKGTATTIEFTGSRIDLIGRKVPNGGTAQVLIDGKPADQAPVFSIGYALPNPKNAPKPPNPPRDRAPHLVELGANIVPQKWTIRLTSDTGDYKLVGSVTGPDGAGNNQKPFASTSGQIRIDPAYWRGSKDNRTGDTYTFEVTRCAVGRVDLKGEAGKVRIQLIRGLPNGPHTLRLIAAGDGPIAIDAFDVFEPPLK